MALTTIPAAGAKLRGSILNSLITEVRPVPGRKTADETVNNSATMQNDNEIFVAVEANAVYEAHLHLVYQSNATPAFKYGFTVPTGATTPAWSFLGSGGGGALIFSTAGTDGGVVGLFGAGANATLEAWGLVVIGANAGTMQLQWAQNTANVSDTIVRAGSFLVLNRIS